MNDKKIKVLFVTYEYGKDVKGGVGRVINGIGAKLNQDLDVDIIINKSKSISFNMNLLLVSWFNYICFSWYMVFQFRNQKLKKSYHLRLKAALVNLIKKEKYDIVHLFHNGEYPEAVVKILRKNFPGIKIVYSCHSIAQYDVIFRNSSAHQLKNEHYIIHNIDHLHLLNQTSLEYLKQSYPQTDCHFSYSIIPNGINEINLMKKGSHYERKIQRLVKKDDPIIVLCMSRWSYGKGLEYLLDAIPKVTDQFKNIYFIIAGRKLISWENGFASYTRMINQKIKAQKQNVIALGWLNDYERNALFSKADIWVMPSLLEYFPYSILEPMAAKIPIISARIDSVQEMLRENAECVFYDPQDSGQLAQQIINLANNAELRAKIAQNAFQKAQSLYQWETIAEMYRNMYHDLLDDATTDLKRF